MSTFSVLLGQNAFPTLQSLRVSYNHLIGDQGVELLVEGLLAPACRTRLKVLGLRSVEMDDKGMAALASAVREGRFERLGNIDIRGNKRVRMQGLCALARAVQASKMHGLHRLLRIAVDGQYFDEANVVKLAHVLLDN